MKLFKIEMQKEKSYRLKLCTNLLLFITIIGLKAGDFYVVTYRL